MGKARISTRCVCLASGLALVLMAGPMPMSASAQSARDAKTRAALLALQGEFAEPLVEVTPDLLRLQQQLVEARRAETDGARKEQLIGQRTWREVGPIEQNYYRELEILQVMTARLNNKSISEKDLLKIRIAVRATALASLKKESEVAQDRFQGGEVTPVDIAGIKATELKAEIMLEALKRAAGK
jgi:hypothetical protein